MACWSAGAGQCRAGLRTADIDKDEALDDRQHNGQVVDGEQQLLLQIRTGAAEGFGRPVLRIEDFVLRPSHQIGHTQGYADETIQQVKSKPHMHHQTNRNSKRPACELARIGLALIVEAKGNRGVDTDAEVVVGNGQRNGIAALLAVSQ